jgi:hypothetical protein
LTCKTGIITEVPAKVVDVLVPPIFIFFDELPVLKLTVPVLVVSSYKLTAVPIAVPFIVLQAIVDGAKVPAVKVPDTVKSPAMVSLPCEIGNFKYLPSASATVKPSVSGEVNTVELKVGRVSVGGG